MGEEDEFEFFEFRIPNSAHSCARNPLVPANSTNDCTLLLTKSTAVIHNLITLMK